MWHNLDQPASLYLGFLDTVGPNNERWPIEELLWKAWCAMWTFVLRLRGLSSGRLTYINRRQLIHVSIRFLRVRRLIVDVQAAASTQLLLTTLSAEDVHVPKHEFPELQVSYLNSQIASSESVLTREPR